MFGEAWLSTQVAVGRGVFGRGMLGIFRGGGAACCWQEPAEVGSVWSSVLPQPGHRVVLAGRWEGSHGAMAGSALPGLQITPNRRHLCAELSVLPRSEQGCTPGCRLAGGR